MILVGKNISPSYNKIMVMDNGRIGWLLITVMLIITGLTTVKAPELSANNTKVMSQINPSVDMKFLGMDDHGYVVREGPYGNQSATITIAYILGVHPMEYKSHWAIKKALMERKYTLGYKYYIYEVSVQQDRYDYNLGRIHGQELARDYVVPDVIEGGFDLVIDVHSNRGNYSEKRFITVPVSNPYSERIAWQMVDKLPWLKYFIPPAEKGPTSGPYVSIPLIRSGTPTLVYETYRHDHYDLVVWQAVNLVEVLDEIHGTD
jgi:hypothetical protein